MSFIQYIGRICRYERQLMTARAAIPCSLSPCPYTAFGYCSSSFLSSKAASRYTKISTVTPTSSLVKTAFFRELKRLDNSHKKELMEHYRKLSKEDQRARFMSAVSIEAIEKDYIDKIDFVRDGVFGAYAICKSKGQSILAGVVQVNQSTETSLSVDPAYRCSGYGLVLMKQAIAYARETGYSHLRMTCLGDNMDMVKLARKVGFVLQRDDANGFDGVLNLKPASQQPNLNKF